MTRLVRTVDELRGALAAERESGRRVGLVPTMGALHAGHLALVAEAQKRAQVTVVTIFVNPTQFAPHEDLARYPRDLEGDLAGCEKAGVNFVFAPESGSEIYPKGDETRVRVAETAAHLEGAFRPVHFEGVATVCCKLFHIAGPCVAVFGRKDYQQLQVVKRMTADLFLPVEIVGLATHREPDGLALSSRNRYLSAEDRKKAVAIAQGLDHALAAFDAGERNVGVLITHARTPLDVAGFTIDYVAIADADSVKPLSPDDHLGGRALLAIAARLGNTRLIDNLVLGEDPSPFVAAARQPT